MDNGKNVGMAADELQARLDGSNKFGTEARFSFVVPSVGFPYLSGSSGTKDDVGQH